MAGADDFFAGLDETKERLTRTKPSGGAATATAAGDRWLPLGSAAGLEQRRLHGA